METKGDTLRNKVNEHMTMFLRKSSNNNSNVITPTQKWKRDNKVKYEEMIKNWIKQGKSFTEWNTGYGSPNWWLDVDVGVGRYRFDCCGFVKYMLNEALPGHNLEEFLVTEKHCPNVSRFKNGSGAPEEWIDWAEKLKNKGGRHNGWQLMVAPTPGYDNVNVIKPGDILIKRDHIDKTGKLIPVEDRRGHMLIAMGTPNPDGHLLIADSTSMAEKHSNDSRQLNPKTSYTGMGTGKIKVRTLNGKTQIVWSTDPKEAYIKPLYVVRPVSN
jgi:hypothetical protein